MTLLMYEGMETTVPGWFQADLTATLERGIRTFGKVRFIFRADDIGVPGDRFFRMTDLFLSHGIPLGLAVVPAWLTRQRWDSLAGVARAGGRLLIWHQHGWRHINHEPAGKKQEFGPSRTRQEVFRDIGQGRTRLESILQQSFTQIFTPPWNRCGRDALDALAELRFTAVSGSVGSFPGCPDALAEFPMHADLHTRKDTTPDQGRQAFLEELSRGMAGPACGIMLHHTRMTPQAFIFLEFLLQQIVRYPEIECPFWGTTSS